MKKLSNTVRNNIIESMYHMQSIGEFEGRKENEMKFENVADKDLILYRDEYLVHETLFGDREYIEYLQKTLYDEDVYKYWKIDKERI